MKKHDETPNPPGPGVKQTLAVFAAVLSLSLIAGLLVALIFAGSTDFWIKFGLMVVLCIGGYLLATIVVRSTTALVGMIGETRTIHTMAALMAIILIAPAGVVAMLFGII